MNENQGTSRSRTGVELATKEREERTGEFLFVLSVLFCGSRFFSSRDMRALVGWTAWSGGMLESRLRRRAPMRASVLRKSWRGRPAQSRCWTGMVKMDRPTGGLQGKRAGAWRPCDLAGLPLARPVIV